MKRRRIPTLALVLLGASGCGSSSPADDAPRPAMNATVMVAAAGNTAGVTSSPWLYSGGVTAYRWQGPWVSQPALAAPFRERFFEAVTPGIVLVDATWPDQEALTAPTPERFVEEMDRLYGLLADEVLGGGGTLALLVVGPPRWASSAPDDERPVSSANQAAVWSRSPPDSTGDYALWRAGAAGITQWFIERHPEASADGRLILLYGAELENHEFYGAIEAYAPAYDAFGRGVRAISAEPRLGGGGRLDAFATKTEPIATDRPVLVDFAAGCASLGCPIDLVFGHNFTLDPTSWEVEGDEAGASSAYADVALSVRKVLSDHGLDDVELMLTDGTTWELNTPGVGATTPHPWLSAEHDTEYRAAHTAAALIAMRRSGYRGHTLGTLFEQADGGGDFSGDWGLFTTSGIIKPTFHALAAMGALQGASLEVAVARDEAPFVVADATRAKGETRVVLSRFVPDTTANPRLLLGAFATRLLRLRGAVDLCADEGLCSEADLLAVLVDRKVDGYPFTEPFRRILDGWWAHFDRAATAPRIRSVSLAVGGLVNDRVTVLRSEVSARRANAYTVCIRNGQACDDPWAVNDGAAALVTEASDIAAADGTIRLDVELEPHHVVLLRLR
ncbi:MAG: hypothetical protein AAGN82_22750 [Myxococcota bacterium]